MLEDFLSFDLKRKDENYLERAFMSIASLDTCVTTVICSLAEKEKRGGYHQKKYADIYGRIAETANK